MTASILGVLYVFQLPPLQAPDENRHFVRALAVAQGQWKPHELTKLPSGVGALIRAFPPVLAGVGKKPFGRSDLPQEIWRPANAAGSDILVANPAGNLYSPVPYWPSAAIMRVAWLLGASPAWMLYAGRLANLTCYIVLCSVALRLAPDNWLALLALTLMPMSIHQAGSLSPDAANIGLTVLLIAYVMRQVYLEERLKTRAAATILVILLLATLCKFNFFFAALVVVIPYRRFGTRAAKALFVSGCILACLITAFAWQYCDKQEFEAFREWKAGKAIAGAARADLVLMNNLLPDAVMAANARAIEHHPSAWARSVVQTLIRSRVLYVRQFVGMLGWLSLPLPKPVVELYFFLVVFLLLVKETERKLTSFQRICLLAIAAASSVAVFVTLSVFETPGSELNELLKGHAIIIQGIQGRYFIPSVLLLPFAISTFTIRNYGSIAAYVVTLIIVGSNVIALLMLGSGYPHLP